jgi:urease gamma subunit
MIYWDPITKMPVGGLGLESARDGMEDFQLMRMAEKVLGKDAVMAYVHRITTSVTEFTSDAELLNQVKLELANALLAAQAQ